MPNLVLLSLYCQFGYFMALFQRNWLLCWVVIRIAVIHHWTSAISYMSIQTITIFEKFLAILTNIVVIGFGVGIPHMPPHVMPKIARFATKQTFDNPIALLITKVLKKLVIFIIKHVWSCNDLVKTLIDKIEHLCKPVWAGTTGTMPKHQIKQTNKQSGKVVFGKFFIAYSKSRHSTTWLPCSLQKSSRNWQFWSSNMSDPAMF